MPQFLCMNLVHLVFSTRRRIALLDNEISPRLWAYTAAGLDAMDCPPVIVGGVQDHVHILFSLSKNLAMKDVVRDIKVSTSKWVKTQGPQYKRFAWQQGYGAFSVSPSNKRRVMAYIAAQPEHHRVRTFQDEFRAMLRKHGLEFDEQYVWD